MPDFSKPNVFYDKRSDFKYAKGKNNLNYFYSFNAQKEMNAGVNIPFWSGIPGNAVEQKHLLSKPFAQKIKDNLRVQELFERMDFLSLIDDYERK